MRFLQESEEKPRWSFANEMREAERSRGLPPLSFSFDVVVAVLGDENSTE